MTVETKGIAEKMRGILETRGYSLEYLGQAYWNVSCEEEETDNMTDLLDDLNIEWRLV